MPPLQNQFPSTTKLHHAYSLKIDDQFHRLEINVVISHKFLEEFKRASLEHPLKDEFTIDEDKLLLFVDLKGKLEYEEEKRASSALLEAYKEEKKKDSPRYPKNILNEETGDRLRERLSTLRNMGLRYQILCNQVSKEIEALKEEIEKEGKDDNEILYIKAKKQREKRSMETKTVTSNTNSIIPTIGSPLVEITLVGKGFGPVIMTTHEQFLSSASVVLRKMLDETSPVFSVDEMKETNQINGKKRITFSENDKKYKEIKMYNCFHPTTFTRFLLYCENQDLQDRYANFKQKLLEVNTENQTKVNEAIEQLLKTKEKRIKEFEEKVEKYKEELVQTLEKCKEFDMDRLSMLYEIHKYNELEKADKLLKARKKEIDNFYKEEISKTTELFISQQVNRKDQIEADVKKCEDLLAEIYPKGAMIPLLILSDLLQATDLKAECIKVVSNDFYLYKNEESLGSKLLSINTLGQVIAHLPIPMLIELQENVGYFFPKSLIDTELEYRKGMFADEYRDKSPEELIQILEAGNVIFPDILKQEIDRRRTRKPFVFLDPERCSPFLKIEEDGLTVSMQSHKRYSCVHATHSRNYEGWNRWYFEVTIVKFEEVYGSSISIGWDVERTSFDGPVIGLTPGKRNKYGYSWQSDGCK
ncbi:hypothetical protein ABK040_002105 [Willaertia magna]